MSIALSQKVKELERRLDEFHKAQIELLNRLAALENRPKPGRPPKNG